jgi:hypothetical protein
MATLRQFISSFLALTILFHEGRAQPLAFTTTLAGGNGFSTSGSVDGVGQSALFDAPRGIAVDATGTVALVVSVQVAFSVCALFFRHYRHYGSDREHDLNSNKNSHFVSPSQVDTDSHVLRSIDVSSATVTTIAGRAYTNGHADGVGTIATFDEPRGVAVDASGAIGLIVGAYAIFCA